MVGHKARVISMRSQVSKRQSKAGRGVDIDSREIGEKSKKTEVAKVVRLMSEMSIDEQKAIFVLVMKKYNESKKAAL